MDEKQGRQLGLIEVLKTYSDQQDALREIKTNSNNEPEKTRPFDSEKKEIESFYLSALGMQVDFTDVKISPRPQIETDLVLLAVEKRIKLGNIINNNRTDCIIRINPSISLESINSPYTTNRAYIVWAVDSARPDLRIMSQRNTFGKRIMTIEERVLFGLKTYAGANEGHHKNIDLEMPTITSSYVEIKREMKAIIVRYQNGGMQIDYIDRNTSGGAREIFGFE